MTVADVVQLVGAALVVAGVCLISIPVGLILAGLFVTVAGIIMERGGNGSSSPPRT